MAELRVTDTNSANDSKGRAFGLEGNDFMIVLVATVTAMALYLICTVVLRIHALGALVLSLPLLLVSITWVLLLRHNKPAGYAEDWFDHQVNREGWSYAPGSQAPRSSK
jgi:hypothetical protein